MRLGLQVALSGAVLFGVTGVTYGGPPDGDTKAGADTSVDTGAVPQIRRRMEADMEEITGMVQRARQEGELVVLACVVDKQGRAQVVLEVGTDELIVISDGESTAQARRFAVEKLEAAGARMTGLLEEAKQCWEDGTGGKAKAADTNLDAPKTIPIEDPTKGPDIIPPPGDDTRPPYVASPPM